MLCPHFIAIKMKNVYHLSFRHFELNPFCTRIHKLDNTKRITKATLFPRGLITNDRLVAQQLQFPHVVKCQQRLSSREQVLCSPSAVVTPGHPALAAAVAVARADWNITRYG